MLFVYNWKMEKLIKRSYCDNKIQLSRYQIRKINYRLKSPGNPGDFFSKIFRAAHILLKPKLYPIMRIL